MQEDLLEMSRRLAGTPVPGAVAVDTAKWARLAGRLQALFDHRPSPQRPDRLLLDPGPVVALLNSTAVHYPVASALPAMASSEPSVPASSSNQEN